MPNVSLQLWIIRFKSDDVPSIGSEEVDVGISTAVLVNPVPEDTTTGFSGFLQRTLATGNQLWGNGGKYLNPVIYYKASSTGNPVMYFSLGWNMNVTVVLIKTEVANLPNVLPL